MAPLEARPSRRLLHRLHRPRRLRHHPAAAAVLRRGVRGDRRLGGRLAHRLLRRAVPGRLRARAASPTGSAGGRSSSRASPDRRRPSSSPGSRPRSSTLILARGLAGLFGGQHRGGAGLRGRLDDAEGARAVHGLPRGVDRPRVRPRPRPRVGPRPLRLRNGRLRGRLARRREPRVRLLQPARDARPRAPPPRRFAARPLPLPHALRHPSMGRLLGATFFATLAFVAMEATFALLGEHRFGLQPVAARLRLHVRRRRDRRRPGRPRGSLAALRERRSHRRGARHGGEPRRAAARALARSGARRAGGPLRSGRGYDTDAVDAALSRGGRGRAGGTLASSRSPPASASGSWRSSALS